MNYIITLFFTSISVFSGYSQVYVQTSNYCFSSDDYVCAIIKYSEAFKLTSGKDRQVAEIKLTRAKWCAEHLKTVNRVLADKNYLIAKKRISETFSFHKVLKPR